MNGPSTPAPVGLRGGPLVRALEPMRTNTPRWEAHASSPELVRATASLQGESAMRHAERELMRVREAGEGVASESPRSLKGDALARVLAGYAR